MLSVGEIRLGRLMQNRAPSKKVSPSQTMYFLVSALQKVGEWKGIYKKTKLDERRQ